MLSRILLVSAFLSLPVFAAEPNYRCSVSMALEDSSRGFYKEFDIVAEEHSHGNGGQEFGDGEDKLILLMDVRWLAIEWYRGDKLIAKSFSLVQNDSKEHRVLGLQNPENPNELVMLGCLPL